MRFSALPACLLFWSAWAATPLPANEAPVAELFVHPLIARPDQAFLASSPDLSRMDDWFVTVDEFRKSLASLEARGYILVRASDVVEITSTGVSLKTPPVPEGRRPLLLSVDDLNYYRYMRNNGTASQLVVEDGTLRTRLKDPSRGWTEGDEEVPQVLEAFVAAHPDFSYRGARGLIAVTGYAGLFGWTTQWAGPGLADAKAQAAAVVKQLKAWGWEFASHSYSHRSDQKQPFTEWLQSETRWDNEIAPLVSPTPYYVFPFGERWWTYEDRWKVLVRKGYRVFFGVETTSTVEWKEGLPILGRVPLDGRGLRHRHGLLSPFLDPTAVRDTARPPRS